MKEIKVVLKYTSNSFQMVLNNTGIFFLFLVSKIIRIGLFLAFLYFLLQGTNGIAGFSQVQIIFFYLSFNLIDTLGQLLFREVYRFRSLVITGGLDLILTKPIHPLTRVLLGGPDVIDFVMLLLISGVTVWYGVTNLHPQSSTWSLYVLMVFNGILISAAFHISVLAIGVMTTSVDHIIMIYRDLTALMRIPVDLYVEPIKTLLTFVLPLGIMFTFPPKILLGLLDAKFIVLAFAFGIVAILLALKFWDYSLCNYQSASS